MAVDSYILDGNGRGTKGSVTSIGEIVVGVFSHDLTMFVKLEVDDTAYNFYVPRDGEQFVITGMRIKASRSVSNTVDAEIIIYEAEGPTDLTVIKILHEEAMIRIPVITNGSVHIESLINPGSRVFFGIDEILTKGDSMAITFEPNDSNTSMKTMAAIICHLSDPND